MFASILDRDYSNKDLIKHFFLVSGIFDLREIWHTKALANMSGTENPLGLDNDLAYKLSPMFFTCQYVLRVRNYDEIKIQAFTIESYDKIVLELTNKNTEFYSFQKKQDRPFRVVLRNMHSSSDTNLIKEQLEEQGHQVTKITNIRNRLNKAPLPMFFVDLKMSPNNKDIYKIEFLLNSKIKFEAPNKKREIPQCLRCQRYGHTKNFCFRQPRCVKCADYHLTSNCQIKNRTKEVKCVHCDGNHPANYRGCSVYKELQRKKYQHQPIKSGDAVNVLQHQRVAPGTSYAQMVKSSVIQQTNVDTPVETDDMSELKHMMKSLMEQMSTMLSLLTTLVSKIKNV